MENNRILGQLQELDLLDLDKAVLLQSQHIRDHIVLNKTSENKCTLQQHLTTLNCFMNSPKIALSENTCIIILHHICIPVLKSIHLSFDCRKENVSLLGLINKIITGCLKTENEASFQPLFELCVKSLKTHIEIKSCSMDSQSQEGVLDLQVCLDLILTFTQKKENFVCQLFEMTSYLNLNDKIFSSLLCILRHFQNQTINTKALRCILNILKNVKQQTYLNSCWELIEKMWVENKEAETLNIYLCGFSNFFFPIDGICSINVRNKNTFWEIIQKGLNAKNPLTRKQSLYLIKRNVDLCEKFSENVNSNLSDGDVPLFWWSKERQRNHVKVWEDLVMLLETFEEKQIHVIKPLFPRLQTLLKAASIEDSVQPLLHTSWLSVVFRRGISHESITLVKWMAEQVLYLDFEACPMIQQGQDKYLADDFLHSIQDPRLFARPPKAVRGTIPTCVEGLIHLFQSCWKALKTDDKRGQFFSSILETLSTSNWGPVPLMFICQALSCVPNSKILDKQALFCLRKIITIVGAASGVFMRGATESFCVRILISLSNTGTVTPKEFAMIFSVFHTEDGLARGTTLWTDCVGWLKNLCKEDSSDEWSPKSLNEFLVTSVNSLLQINQEDSFTSNETDVVQVTRLMLLAVDSGILPLKVEPEIIEPCMTQIVLTLTNIIVSIPNHPYMSYHKAERAVLILISLLRESGSLKDDNFSGLIKKSVQDCLSSMLLFTTQMLIENWKQISCVQSIELLVDGLVHFLQCQHAEQINQQLLKLTNTCIQIIMESNKKEKIEMETQIKKLASMGILSSISSVLQDEQRSIKDRILSFTAEYNCTTSFDKPLSDISHKEWGKIASLFISYQWIVMEYYLSHVDVVDKPIVPILKVCQDSLSVCGGQNTIPVYRCIRYLLSKELVESDMSDCLCRRNRILKNCKVPNESSSIIEALSVSWSHVQGENKSTCFWEVLGEFIYLTFQPALFQQPQDSSLTEVLIKYANDLMKLGREKTGVGNILMRRLCTIWKTSLNTVEGFYFIIGQASMYGNIFRKQDRQLFDVFAYIESLGKHCSVNELKPHTTKDIMVRAEVASLICSLSPKSIEHQEFAVNLLQELSQQYKMVEEESFTPGTITNSFIHRKKHRLLQIVLLLEPFIDEKNFDILWTFVWDLLMLECQPSLRHTCEWIIMRMVLKKIDVIDELWSIFDQLTEKKSTVLCSIMCIMSHIGTHLPPDKQEAFYCTSFKKLLPWCMANHFNTRIHAAAALLKQWDQCKMLELSKVMTMNSTAYSCLTFHQESNNYTKNIQRLLENFFFQTFDSIQDFSLETIFQMLPWLFLIPDDEWISPQQFEPIVSSISTCIPVYNSNEKLKTETPGSWRFKNPGGALEDSDTEDNTEGDVQKKIMPWRLMIPDEEVQDELEYSNRKRDEGGLIVVTSLIDKIPNLGGLCRSSEIFGVSQYVIGRMKYLDDKMFKDLSVTAHKWLPITEVWHELLPQYLTEKKQEGYTLIGVEQTANSVSLTDFTFPKKSLLLLGNEKEGIPVELINQLDVCVEIPQQGIIRSLNVHVSGALLIWEYRRQQLVNNGDFWSV